VIPKHLIFTSLNLHENGFYVLTGNFDLTGNIVIYRHSNIIHSVLLKMIFLRYFYCQRSRHV
jgi:hypothetical protein